MRFEEHIRRQWQDPQYRAAFEELAPNLETAAQVVAIRSTLGWSQEQLAEKVGTKQASISRLENSLGNPRLDFLKRVAKALGTRLNVRFERQTLTGPEEVFGVPMWQVAWWPVLESEVLFGSLAPWGDEGMAKRDTGQLSFLYEVEP